MPARVAEDLVALFDVGQAIVQQRENCRGNLLTQAIAGAKILVDPDLHALSVPFWSFERTYCWSHGTGGQAEVSITRPALGAGKMHTPGSPPRAVTSESKPGPSQSCSLLAADRTMVVRRRWSAWPSTSSRPLGGVRKSGKWLNCAPKPVR